MYCFISKEIIFEQYMVMNGEIVGFETTEVTAYG